MRTWLLAAAGGIVAQAHSPWLAPAVAAAALLIAAAAVRFCLRRGWRRALASGLAFGLAWGILAGHRIHERLIEPRFERQDLIVEGYVAGLPSSRPLEDRGGSVQRFDFALYSARDLQSGETLPLRRLRLSWYQPPTPVAAGERWRLTVRAKRPRDFWNPGGSDRAALMLGAGVGAVGYVRDRRGRDIVERLPGRDWRALHHRLRAFFIGRLEQIHQGPQRGLIAALALGDRRELDADTRQLLRRTGTAHLLAVSGLHIGLAAALFYMLGARLAQGLLLPLRWRPAPIWGAGCALFGAACYASMAGLSLPTRRALIMVATLMLALLMRRRLRLSAGYCLALFIVLALEPLATFGAGFWLSFAAAGALTLAFGGERDRIDAEDAPPGLRRAAARRATAWLRNLLLAQVVVTLALLAPLGYFFGEVPLTSPLANLFAIPWVGFAVVPTALGGVFLSPLSESVAAASLNLCAEALRLLFATLRFLDQLPLPPWRPPPWNVLSMFCAASGVIIWLAASGRRRHWALLLLAPLLAPNFTARGGADSALRLSVFDVGQGTSVLARTPSHALLYDVGPRLGRIDAARLAVLPALRRLGARRLDRLVLSHGDADHAGGLLSLLEETTPDFLMRPDSPGAADLFAAPGGRAAHCEAGQTWRWQGVDFEVLHPPAGVAQRNENNHSCVLLIRAAGMSVLLPGDIEADVEQALLPRLRAALEGRRLDVLLVAHHGSATSSSAPWVQALRPRYAVYSAGRLNRYGHPHPEVRARFEEIGAVGLSTVSAGAVHFHVDRRGRLAPPMLERALRRRHWNEAPPKPRFPANIAAME